MSALLVLTTFSDLESARRTVRVLVEERLAACANLLPGVESVYRWKGVIETASEVTAMLKTTAGRYPALEARLKELHPYELPEIVAVEIRAGLGGYLAWVAENCEPEGAA